MLLCCTKAKCALSIISAIPKLHQRRLLNISCQVERLPSRGLIRVSGPDVTSFMQGIVTNDMNHFQESCKTLFTMFLNTKGRVLYDSIVYKRNENTFFLECDSNGLHDLVKHLKMYRVRKKIDIDVVDDEWKLWVLFNPQEIQVVKNHVKNIKQEQIVPCMVPNPDGDTKHAYFNDIILSSETSVYTDPRLHSLGSRVIAPASEDVVAMVRETGIQIKSSTPWSYRMFRYRLGVGEGTEELPIGKCFPLETNCDYLHGVSFHKGCYIGQELTARTHHTGVVRKRLMPLSLCSELSDVPIDTPIEPTSGSKKTAIGKLRGLEKNCALGLMRIAEALEEGKFRIGSVEGETLRPYWWPQELPKERMDSGSKRS